MLQRKHVRRDERMSRKVLINKGYSEIKVVGKMTGGVLVGCMVVLARSTGYAAIAIPYLRRRRKI